MAKSKKFQEIILRNAEYEKQTPYNYCDRWCQRCSYKKQIRCTLYKDELECKMACIAHGKDEDDPEINERFMEAQYKEVENKLKESADKFGFDLNYPGIGELSQASEIDFEKLPEDIQEHIRFVENNPLDKAAGNYCHKTHAFLKKTFYKDAKAYSSLKYDFETVAWYHTLLSAKLRRALCGFHKPTSEGDISLYDAVAQFEICRKAAKNSIVALQKIKDTHPSFRPKITELLALLHNILSRIELMEQEI
jgi:hypothetical protein